MTHVSIYNLGWDLKLVVILNRMLLLFISDTSWLVSGVFM